MTVRYLDLADFVEIASEVGPRRGGGETHRAASALTGRPFNVEDEVQSIVYDAVLQNRPRPRRRCLAADPYTFRDFCPAPLNTGARAEAVLLVLRAFLFRRVLPSR